METYEAIMTRRSVTRPGDGSPTKEQIAKLLAAAVRAPNHHLTQPWRFVVLTGDALKELGRAWAAGVEREGDDSTKIIDKPLRAPVIVTVLEKPHSHNPRIVELEEHYAVGAAMQNILLAAHDMGLGAMIRTGHAAHLKEVLEYMGAERDELIAGFIYIGFPREGDDERPFSRRIPAEDKTEWRGWE
jgi:nitroreductase